MREARQGGFSRQGRADAQCKSGQMRNDSLGRRFRQGSQMREAYKSDARGKAGQMREESPGICVRQGRTFALGKDRQIRDAREDRR
jgi:hypothetical protein